MLKIMILEDQKIHAERLSSMLERYAQTRNDFAYTLQHFDSAVALVTEYCCDADILFLDTQMPDMSGMEAARRIRAVDERVMIIFITMLTQYAVEGYSVGAFDYVLKPIRFDEFAAKMDRACRLLSHRSTSQTIDIRNRDEIRRVNVDDVIYIEVSNHDVMIHTGTDVYKQWGNLKTYEAMLSTSHFVRCNACYLVNLKYVQGIHGDHVQMPQQALMISKSKRKDFMAALARYRGGSR